MPDNGKSGPKRKKSHEWYDGDVRRESGEVRSVVREQARDAVRLHRRHDIRIVDLFAFDRNSLYKSKQQVDDRRIFFNNPKLSKECLCIRGDIRHWGRPMVTLDRVNAARYSLMICGLITRSSPRCLALAIAAVAIAYQGDELSVE